MGSRLHILRIKGIRKTKVKDKYDNNEPLAKLSVIPECLYRGYGFCLKNTEFPLKSSAGMTSLESFARGSNGNVLVANAAEYRR
jgi:hypothetical protein